MSAHFIFSCQVPNELWSSWTYFFNFMNEISHILMYKSIHKLKDLYGVQQPSPCDIVRSFLQPHFFSVIFATSFLQHHFCNVILIRRIILIFCFGQNHSHRPYSCPCRQQPVHDTQIPKIPSAFTYVSVRTPANVNVQPKK